MGGHRRIDAESVDAFVRAANGATASTQMWKVVIVDDSEEDRELLCAVIEATLPQAQITTATNGYEGLITIGQIEPDIVVTDLIMPKMDGFVLLSELMHHSTFHPRLVVAATSLDPYQLVNKGALPEGVALIHKPIHADALLDIFEARLEY